jgi:glycerol-3-phosphate responsive antiterminator
VLAKCCSGTGQWILNHEDFIKWRDGANGNHSSSRFFFLCWKFRGILSAKELIILRGHDNDFIG